MFLFFSMLLVCSFFRLKELFQMKNSLTTSLQFFSENAKNLGRSDNAKRRKKRGWPNDLSRNEIYRFIPVYKTITIIVVSLLFYTSYFTGITILSYVLASQTQVRIFN